MSAGLGGSGEQPEGARGNDPAGSQRPIRPAIKKYKLEGEGFSDAPSDTVYWQHGRSTERDFIYVTTANVSHAQLEQLSEEVAPQRSLLVICSAFRGRKEGYPNLTVRKIPKAILSRCEWGKDGNA